MPMKKKDIEKLLKKPIVAVVAVTAPDGAPHAVPTWFEYADGQIVLSIFSISFFFIGMGTRSPVAGAAWK